MRFCGAWCTQVGPPQAHLIAMRSVMKVPGVNDAKLVAAQFGGLPAAIRLSKEHSLQVMHVDQRNRHLFQRSPYQVGNDG
jgi:hypothetical protein